MIMHIGIAHSLNSPGIRGAILALALVHSNNANYLCDDATVITLST